MHGSRFRRTALLGLPLALAAACTGEIAGTAAGGAHPAGAAGGGAAAAAGRPGAGSLPGGPGAAPGSAAPAALKPPVGGLRALTRTELANTLRDLLGDTGGAVARLPEETLDLTHFAFDNNRHANAHLGLNLVRALELLYQDLMTAALADGRRRALLVPCAPAGPADAACMKQFVADFGLRALRRTLAPEEAALYESFLDVSKEAGDFFAGAGAAARAILMNPAFIYRVEAGEPVAATPGVVKLGGYEIATRLSYTLAGTTPDRPLLEEARAGRLDSAEGRRAAAARLLGAAGARPRMLHFHAYWLGFQSVLAAGAAGDPFLEETRALVNDVLFDARRDYKELFLSKRTYLASALRKHYDDLGAPAATSAGWVSYPGPDPARPGGERAGILAHGTFLSARRDGDETSIPRRGALIMARLFCAPVPEPPPDLSVDLSGLESQCTTGPSGFYATTHAAPACRACHERLDPVGIGLERFTVTGRYRLTDTHKPQCRIDTGNARVELGGRPVPFDGPAQLARALVDSGALEDCASRHAYRFMTGLAEEADDEPAIADLVRRFRASGRDFAGLWTEMAAAPTFALARLPGN